MTTSPPKPSDASGRAMRILTSRPHLLSAIAVGILTWLVLFLGNDLRWSTRAILAWDAGCLTFIASMMIHMIDKNGDHIRQAAARQDEGQGLIMTLVLTACVASLASVAAELGMAKSQDGLEQLLRVGLVTLTVAASWFMVQLIFALHYAHLFYGPDETGGLKFPGEGDPDYWDFIHFSVVIGAAAQTADIDFTSKVMRRIGTLHSVIAFTFNTVVLALSINLLASLL